MPQVPLLAAAAMASARIARLYSQAESPRKSPDRERDGGLNVSAALAANIRRRAGGTKPTCGTLGRVQTLRFDEFRLTHRRNDQLRDPHAAGDDERFGAEIDENDLHFASVVCIDG